MASAMGVEVPRKIRKVLCQEAYCGGTIAVVVEQEPPIQESTRPQGLVVMLFEGDRVVERRHTHPA
jgi:hypothetical protein